MRATGETKFSVMVSLFEWIQKSKYSAKKRSTFRKFIDNFCNPIDYFAAVRLILPSLDRERGSYGLKESVLATSLIDALAMSRDSPDALRLINWRKGGAKTGANAGNFALVATEVLQRRQGTASGGLTIKELNDLLDHLASSENRAEKTAVLSTMIKRTNTQEMKWIIMIILKDLKLGISEKSIFHEFHPDAQDLFNVTCDLKLVCEKLRDRSQRHKRQDIEVGKPVRPQLAKRVTDAHAAWKKLHGKDVVMECKFDGDRIQIHKNGVEVHYFSRNFLDHSEYGHGMSDIVVQNVLADRCILDGEMLVWDSSLNRFAEFGSNQEIAKAAKDGLDSDRQLCYVAFDILYVGDTSVIHQSLKERHELLRKIVKPLKGRLEILLPNDGLKTHRPPGESCWSLVAYNVDDVEKFFKQTIENRDEGIVLKDLGSKWEPSDRSGKWLKLKPEYIHPGSDLDVLIIGGYYGSGCRGGEVAQFLVGLAKHPAPNQHPRQFISFCRVGTGLSADELDAVVTKLKPYFRRNEYPKKSPPSFYEVTNNSKERPDVWVDNPEKSMVLSITSDIRTIRSEVFAAPYSLRFPRIEGVRYDKPWHECLDVQSFVELVHSSNGTTQNGKEYGGLRDSKPARFKSLKKGKKKNVSVVPSHLIHTDVSDIKGESLIFSNVMFYFINVPSTHSLESLHKMVAENGGIFSMNLNSSVTHCVAAESKGIKYKAAKAHRDIIHYSWVLDCCSEKKLLPLQPKYFLFLADSSKKKLQEEIDEFSDSYYFDLDLADIKRLLNNINTSEDANIIECAKKKYCPKDKWSLFHGCCIFFYTYMETLTTDWQSILGLTVRRLKLEVLMGDGKVTNNLVYATHLVVLTAHETHLDFQFLMNSLNVAEKHCLRNKRLYVVGSQWLDESLEREQKLQEEAYNLKPSGFEELYFEDCKVFLDAKEAASDLDAVGNQKLSGSKAEQRIEAELEDSRALVSPKKEAKRKRERPVGGNSKKGKVSFGQAPKRARVGRKRARISEDKSDESSSSFGDKINDKEIEMNEGNQQNSTAVSRKNSEVQRAQMEKYSESSKRGKVVQVEVADDNRIEEIVIKTPDTEMAVRQDGQKESFDKDAHIEIGERHYGLESEKLGKLEIMGDPVHAMLLDMIPSLETKKVETVNPEAKKVETVNPVVDDDNDNVAQDPNPPPVKKKKKVSYKDVASELLKDW